MNEFATKILPFMPAFSAIIAALALIFTAYRLWHQWRVSALLVRYDAVRNKRSVAKALRWEILEIEKALPGRLVEPTLYIANATQVGRMDDASIETSIKFYTYVNGNSEADPSEVSQKANAAILAIDLFLKDSLDERRILDAKIKNAL